MSEGLGLGRGHHGAGQHPARPVRGRPDPADPELRAVPHRREIAWPSATATRFHRRRGRAGSPSVRAAPTSPALVAGAQDVVRQQREADFRRALPAAALLEPMGRLRCHLGPHQRHRHAVPDPRRRVHVGRLHERVQPAGGLGRRSPVWTSGCVLRLCPARTTAAPTS